VQPLVIKAKTILMLKQWVDRGSKGGVNQSETPTLWAELMCNLLEQVAPAQSRYKHLF